MTVLRKNFYSAFFTLRRNLVACLQILAIFMIKVVENTDNYDDTLSCQESEFSFINILYVLVCQQMEKVMLHCDPTECIFLRISVFCHPSLASANESGMYIALYCI